MKIVTSDQMRELELRSEASGVSVDTLMENAGLAVAQKVRELLGYVNGLFITVLVGPGNNGSDGLVCARHLAHWGARVDIYLCAQRRDPDSKLGRCLDKGVPVFRSWEDHGLQKLSQMLLDARLVVDAVLGTGHSRHLEGTFKAVMEQVQEAQKANRELILVALDLPTGLDCDTGAVDPACVAAEVTVTLGLPKVGQFSFPGAQYVGQLATVDIGVPQGLDEEIPLSLLTPKLIRSFLPDRLPSAHKGTFGKALIVAGSLNYIGAAYLASAAATRVGAGVVTLATAHSLVPPLAAKGAEVTYLPLPESSSGTLKREAINDLVPELEHYESLLLGCGLGQTPSVLEFLKDLLSAEAFPPHQGFVIDADGLNNLAAIPSWWKSLPPGTCVLTPHPREMERLLGTPVAEVQRDRVGVARQAAEKWQQTVVLKGAFTVVADPAGRQSLNPFASAALATAGTGDVLAGAIVGFLAQGLPPFQAAAGGAYVHGLAGQLLSKEIGDAGVIASDLLPTLPRAIRKIKEGNQ